jgi:hypothetical protein
VFFFQDSLYHILPSTYTFPTDRFPSCFKPKLCMSFSYLSCVLHALLTQLILLHKTNCEAVHTEIQTRRCVIMRTGQHRERKVAECQVLQITTGNIQSGNDSWEIPQLQQAEANTKGDTRHYRTETRGLQIKQMSAYKH